MTSPLVVTDPPALHPLPTPYRALFRGLLEAALPDERIRAVWLGGSLARGDADAASDLDVLLAVRDADLEEFDSGWRDWLATITPTLIATALPFAPATFTATTTAHCRLDVVTETVTGVATTPHRRRVVVLDRDGLDARVPVPEPGPGPDTDRLVAMCTEYLRIEGITPFVLLERGDLLSVAAGTNVLQGLLVEILAETNRPLPPMGVKRFASRLTTAQQQVLLALPCVGPRHDDVVASVRALGAAFRGPVRTAVETAGAAWPDAVADAVGAFVDRSLDAGHARP